MRYGFRSFCVTCSAGNGTATYFDARPRKPPTETIAAGTILIDEQEMSKLGVSGLDEHVVKIQPFSDQRILALVKGLLCCK